MQGGGCRGGDARDGVIERARDSGREPTGEWLAPDPGSPRPVDRVLVRVGAGGQVRAGDYALRMAKPKKKRRKPGAPRPAVPTKTEVVPMIVEKLPELQAAPDDGGLWGEMHKLLLKSPADSGDAGRLVAMRDLASLVAVVEALQRGDDSKLEEPDEVHFDVAPETMKKAMHAFRKRLKLIRLDHESKLGVGPMTGGKKADVDAIMPPQEFDAEVWDALAAAGELKKAGTGFYALARE